MARSKVKGSGGWYQAPSKITKVVRRSPGSVAVKKSAKYKKEARERAIAVRAARRAKAASGGKVAAGVASADTIRKFLRKGGG